MSGKIRLLLASRAFESPPREGGFVLLSDLANVLTDDSAINPAVFTATKYPIPGIGTEKVFSGLGWNLRLRYEFILGVYRKANKYNVVHTAHIPTSQNVKLLKAATKKAKRSGTVFVQTVTGLPEVSISNEQLANLLWGDWIVCQSPSVYRQVKQLRDSVSLITPWPADKRIAYDEKRRADTRRTLFKEAEKVVLFPGEFERLGVDASFSECLKIFLENTKNALVVLACRFDKEGTGEAIAKEFPGRVITLGETDQIISLLEAADLTIYPVKKMDSKFQPPLILTESLQLSTPILISSVIDLDESTSDLITSQDITKGWAAFGLKMAELVNNQKIRSKPQKNSPFNNMVKDYRQIYTDVVKT